MLFSLEMLPAAEGDCLLLHWGAPPSIAIVDGGPGKVFENTLRGRLDEVRRNLQLDTLPIELIMVSHVDNDHIIGVKKLFRELRNDQTSNIPEDQRKFRVLRLWHNAFTDILGDKFDSYYTAPVTAALTAATSPGASLATFADAGLANLPEDEARQLAFVLAGHAEGRELRDDYKLLFDANQIHRLNTPFLRNGDPSPVMRVSPVAKPKIAGLELLVIGPSELELDRLRADFDKYLVKNGLAVPEALVAAAANQDNSPTNLSSLICLAKLGGKTILLTGDARGDRILDGLAAADLLREGTMHVDVLKVPHHGSARNVTPDFFKAISADTYAISADGKHSNPDRDTIKWLIDSREKNARYEIAFTYPLAEIDTTRRKIHERKQKWDADRDAIETLLTRHKQNGFAFTFSNGRSVIDLGNDKMRW